MASSEFILAPRIDENKARQEMQKMDDVARRSAQQMTAEFDHAWDTIGRKGQSTFSKIGKHLQGAAASMVGNIAANVVMKATEIATDAATKVFQDLEATKQTARERYEQNRDINSEADALGIGRGKYAALDIAGVASGLDASDVRGLMSGFVGALEKPEMEKFRNDANKNGIDKAFLDFIGSTSKLKPEEAAQRMNDVFGDEDALKASKFMKPIQDLMKHGKELNFQNIVDNMAGRHIDIKALEKALNLSEKQMKTMFTSDAEILENKIKEIVKPTSDGSSKADNVAKSDKSTESLNLTKLNTLNIAVAAKVGMDSIEKAEINTGAAVVNSSATWVGEKSKQADDVINTREHMFDDFEHYKRYLVKLSRFLSFDTSTPDIKKGETVHDYLERMRKLGKSSGPTSSLVQETEQQAENNKNRRDTGPLK
ncbi:hypothetical protein [Vibrio algivorus]|uniref:Uncharacterized protein n=1 Tax=Vibrio algivorus TaxID=1667024 RepID=A0A557P348_9VIBR|nr:hypothetical protein [Vibrio algivorus]TVO35086.1 hypothetical protein FOF44_12345 [Vibrio algivorus]